MTSSRTPLFGFSWHVAKNGYEWTSQPMSAGGNASAELSRRLPTDEWRKYEPLIDYTGLFRNFAGTKPDKDGILAFANQYGQLLSPRSVRSEPLALWKENIVQMKWAVELWDMVARQDLQQLGQHIVWSTHPDQGCPVVSYHPMANSAQDAVIIWFELAGLIQIEDGDLIGPALLYISRLVNRRLDEHVVTNLNDATGRNRLVLQFGPKDLLGALWLQFAQGVDGNSRYARCEREPCGRWFEISPERGRPDKRFCSTACRARSYRLNPEGAIQLHREGKTVKEIAELLRTKERTVRKWLKFIT